MHILDLDNIRKFEAAIKHNESTPQGLAGILDSVTCEMDRVVDSHIVPHSGNCRCLILHTKCMDAMSVQFCPNSLYFDCSSRNWAKRSWRVGLTDEQDIIECRACCSGSFYYALNQCADRGCVGRDGKIRKTFPVLLVTAIASCSVER